MSIKGRFAAALAGLVLMFGLAACSTTSTGSLAYSDKDLPPVALSAKSNPAVNASVSSPDNPDLFIVDSGPPQPVDPAGRYYVEFRARWLHELGPLTLIGHTYVIYGRLDASGTPLDRHMVALYPGGGPVGLIASSLPIVVPATTTPVFGDREFDTLAVYKVLINAAQYDAIQKFVYETRSKMRWFNLYTINCNYLAGHIARLAGLKTPPITGQPAELYVKELAMLNDRS